MIELTQFQKEVNEELAKEEKEEAKKLIKAKRKEIRQAEKIVNRLRLDEKDLMTQIAEGL